MAKVHGRGHVANVPRNDCFGCGLDNPGGMKLKFAFDPERRSMVSHFRLAKRYTGPPGHAHGGIIATILDETMGKALKIFSVIAVTCRMEIQFLRPVPLYTTLIAEGKPVRHRGRKYWHVGEIRDEQGNVLARSKGLFVAIDPMKKFGPEVLRLLRSKPSRASRNGSGVRRKKSTALPAGVPSAN